MSLKLVTVLHASLKEINDFSRFKKTLFTKKENNFSSTEYLNEYTWM